MPVLKPMTQAVDRGDRGQRQGQDDPHDGEGERVLKLLLADGLPVKQAAKLAAAITGAAKNALYDRALALKS